MSDIYLSVAVCTHNRAAVLGECVQSILASCARLACPWELVVINNGSTDRTREVLGGFSREAYLRVVEESRLGISYARNAAVVNTTGKVLAFIDDDEIVQYDWAEVLCSEFESQGVEVLGGLMLPIWEAPPPWWLTEELHSQLGLIESKQNVNGRSYPRIFSGNMAVGREAISAMGESPFNTALGRKGRRLTTNEESYLIEQLWRKGVKIGFAENLVIRHRIPKSRMTLRWLLKWHLYWGVSTYREAVIRSGKRRLHLWVIAFLFLHTILIPWCMITFRPRKAVASLFHCTAFLGRVCEHIRTAFPSRRRGVPAPQ